MKGMIGWIAGISFSICAIPLVYDSIKAGHNEQNLLFLGLWLVGEVGMIIDTWKFNHWPSRLNYLFNLACILIVLYYRF